MLSSKTSAKYRDRWIYTDHNENPTTIVFDGVSMDFARVTKRYVKENCIAINPSFFNSHKTLTNAISAFNLPGLNLRYYTNALSYFDMIENKDEIEEIYNYLKTYILRHNGCFITERGKYWDRLVRELVEEGNKYIYVTLPFKGTDVHLCSMPKKKTIRDR